MGEELFAQGLQLPLLAVHLLGLQVEILGRAVVLLADTPQDGLGLAVVAVLGCRPRGLVDGLVRAP